MSKSPDLCFRVLVKVYTPSWQDDRVFRLGAADRLLLLGYEKLGFAKDVILDVLGAYFIYISAFK